MELNFYTLHAVVDLVWCSHCGAAVPDRTECRSTHQKFHKDPLLLRKVAGLPPWGNSAEIEAVPEELSPTPIFAGTTFHREYFPDTPEERKAHRKKLATDAGKAAVSSWFADRGISGGIQTAPLTAGLRAVCDYYETLLTELLGRNPSSAENPQNFTQNLAQNLGRTGSSAVSANDEKKYRFPLGPKTEKKRITDQ